MASPTLNSHQEAVRAMSKIRMAEASTQRIARGLPPEPPPPIAKVGNVLQSHQVTAILSAIAAAPEAERGHLLDEAHQNLTQWIDTNQGKVIIDGEIHLARNQQQAETLAAKLLNRGMGEHAARENAAFDAQRNSQKENGGSAKSPQVDAKNIPQNPPVGSTGEDGRQVTQPANTIEENQALAQQAAPELASHVQRVAAAVPGVTQTRVRPQKNADRLQQKVDGGKEPNTISDYSAAQLAVDSPEAKQSVLEALHRVLPVIHVDDNFDEGNPDKASFPSTNVQGQLSNGMTAEIQIVPHEVADANDESHPHYEAGRDAEAEGDTGTRDEHWDKAAEINQQALEDFKDRNADDNGYAVESAPRYAKGDTVKLRDGSEGVVQYHHPAMNVVRLRVDGKNKTVSGRDVVYL